jgi:hypothetical protein
LVVLRYNDYKENALRRSSIQGTDQAGVDGLIEDIMTLLSRSRQPAVSGEQAALACYPNRSSSEGASVPEASLFAF